VEKAELSQSFETRRAYSAMLERFRQALAHAGLDLDAPCQQVALIAQALAAAGRVRATTLNRRLNILSSFYTYAIERGCSTCPTRSIPSAAGASSSSTRYCVVVPLAVCETRLPSPS
jgi:site-specific recombinase XerD